MLNRDKECGIKEGVSSPAAFLVVDCMLMTVTFLKFLF